MRNVNCDVTAVTVAKTIDKTVVALNDIITYCFEIDNVAMIAQSFDLWDTIPAVTSYIGCDNGCVIDGSNTVVSWPMITVNASDSRTVCFWVIADQYPYVDFEEFLAFLKSNYALNREQYGRIQ